MTMYYDDDDEEEDEDEDDEEDEEDEDETGGDDTLSYEEGRPFVLFAFLKPPGRASTLKLCEVCLSRSCNHCFNPCARERCPPRFRV